MAEAAVVHACTAELDHRGAWWTNVHGGIHGRNGIPDLLACYRGIFLAIECKAPKGGRLRPLQAHELKKIRQAGGYAIVARSRHDVTAVLDQIDRSLDAQAAA